MSTRFTLQEPFAEHEVFPTNPANERDQTISDVMRWVTHVVYTFRDRLRPSELHHFDMNDVLQEMWVELCEKYHYFNKDKAKFITWANRIVKQKLGDIRRRWHTVSGPKTSHGDSESFMRVLRETVSVDGDAANIADDGENCEDMETRKAEAGAAKSIANALINKLDFQEARVLIMYYGLFGEPEIPLAQIAQELGTTMPHVVHLQKNALRQLSDLSETL